MGALRARLGSDGRHQAVVAGLGREGRRGGLSLKAGHEQQEFVRLAKLMEFAIDFQLLIR